MKTLRQELLDKAPRVGARIKQRNSFLSKRKARVEFQLPIEQKDEEAAFLRAELEFLQLCSMEEIEPRTPFTIKLHWKAK